MLPRPRPIGLALQGGGSWGAYTWGALDAILASRNVRCDDADAAAPGLPLSRFLSHLCPEEGARALPRQPEGSAASAPVIKNAVRPTTHRRLTITHHHWEHGPDE